MKEGGLGRSEAEGVDVEGQPGSRAEAEANSSTIEPSPLGVSGGEGGEAGRPAGGGEGGGGGEAEEESAGPGEGGGSGGGEGGGSEVDGEGGQSPKSIS